MSITNSETLLVETLVSLDFSISVSTIDNPLLLRLLAFSYTAPMASVTSFNNFKFSDNSIIAVAPS